MSQWIRKFRYLVPVVAVALAFLFKNLELGILPQVSPALIFFSAVVVSAWMGGLGPGIFATVLSAICSVYFFLPPYYSFWISDQGQAFQLLGFIFEGALVSFLFQSLISARQHSETMVDEALEARRIAEASSQAKKDFIANMSHEIRTPLTALLGFSELAMSPRTTQPEREEYFGKMKNNATVLSHLVDNILKIASAERSDLEVRRHKFAVPEFLRQVAHELRPLAEAKGITLEFNSKGPIPREIETDSGLLFQVLHHIIGNAIKFTELGTVSVTIVLRRQKTRLDTEESGKLAFIVKDQGIGIEPGQIRRLFQPFEQADSSRTRRYGGAGLGLSLARKLARSLGGDIQLVRTKVGQGSTFLITTGIPLNWNAEYSEQFSIRAPSPVAEPTGAPAEELAGVRVLVVEDSPDNSLLVSKYLRMAGAEVETAMNGREGVEKAEHGDYNVVVMDIQMPELDGNEAAKELREHHFEKPIIALSAHAMKEDREEALKSGFNEYLLKPVDRGDLIAKIRRFTQGTPAHA